MIKALKATTLVPGEAGIVMESLINGEGIPSHHEGVWIKKDDDGLALVMTTDFASFTKDPDAVDERRRAARERKRLEHKHGLQRMDARWKFLEDWDSTRS